MRLHEEFEREAMSPESSERAFGMTLTGALVLLGLLPVAKGEEVRVAYFVAAGVLVIFAVVRPSVLRPANWIWTRLGAALHRIVSPLVLGSVFLLVFAPVGLLVRLAGKDPLRVRRARNVPTYWIERSPPGPESKTMSNQF